MKSFTAVSVFVVFMAATMLAAGCPLIKSRCGCDPIIKSKCGCDYPIIKPSCGCDNPIIKPNCGCDYPIIKPSCGCDYPYPYPLPLPIPVTPAIPISCKPDCSYTRPDCICPAIYEPVCATNGCTYGNTCQMACAGAEFAYPGECRKCCC